MLLSHLITTPFLTAEYDAQHSCLFLQLHSRAVFMGTTAEAAWTEPVLAAELPSRCLVQDNLPATSAGADYLLWLTEHLLPKLYQAGIRQWLWVCQPNANSYQLLGQVQRRFPNVLITTFCDVEQASGWLRHSPARQLSLVGTVMPQPANWICTHPIFLITVLSAA